MASKTSRNPPVIDFTGELLEPGTDIWFSTCKNVQNALEKHGYFLAVHDKVSEELNRGIHRTFEEYFNLPMEKKIQYSSSADPYLGYIGQIPQAPLIESITIRDAASAEKVQGFMNLMFSSIKEQFFEIFHSYIKQVVELQDLVMRMLFESYGLEKYYDSQKDSTTYHFRANRYRAPELNENNAGLHPHTDSSLITILEQNQVQGLEVKSDVGNWISVDFPPSSFMVLAGDALQAWSNGRIRPCLHRVTLSAKEARYSVGLFAYRNGIIQIPEELVDDQHPLLFKPFQHSEYFDFVSSKYLHFVEDKLKIYCGI